MIRARATNPTPRDQGLVGPQEDYHDSRLTGTATERGGSEGGTEQPDEGIVPSVAGWWRRARPLVMPHAGRIDGAGHRLRESARAVLGPLDGSDVGCILVEREVSSSAVMLREVSAQDTGRHHAVREGARPTAHVREPPDRPRGSSQVHPSADGPRLDSNDARPVWASDARRSIARRPGNWTGWCSGAMDARRRERERNVSRMNEGISGTDR
jgi:hypothetical protein